MDDALDFIVTMSEALYNTCDNELKQTQEKINALIEQKKAENN